MDRQDRPAGVPPTWTMGAAVTFSLTVLCVLTAAKTHLDLRVYRMGGWALLHGLSPYGRGLPGPRMPYTYTPFSTVVFAPLASIPAMAAVWVDTAVSVGALVVTIHLVARELLGADVPRARVLQVSVAATCVAYWSEPVLQTLGFGQVNLLLMALVTVDLLVLRDRRWAGVLIGIAAGIKLTPLVFVGYLLVSRRFRAAGTAMAAAVGTAVLGWLLLPDPSELFFTKLMFDPSRVGSVGFVGNQSLYGAWTRLLHVDAVAKPYWQVSALVVLALGLAVAAGLRRRCGDLAGLAACALTGLLVSPISWSHHWVWWVVVTAALADQAYRRRSRGLAVVAAAWAVPFFVGPMWRFRPTTYRALGALDWRQPVLDAYPVFGLVLLAAAGAWLLASGERHPTTG